MKRALLVVAALLLAACESPKAKRIEMEKDAVRARLQHFSELMLAMDNAAIAAMFAPQGEFDSPSRTTKGPAAIEGLLDKFSDHKILACSYMATSTLIDGDISEEIGTYSLRVREPTGHILESGGRLEVEWSRSPSGEWLINQLETFPEPKKAP
ncbi:MAG TPA: nuclear transport factor 2 family protein [Opitutaceae bacterium]|jgi:ketosteroid isomerase-like protein